MTRSLLDSTLRPRKRQLVHSLLPAETQSVVRCSSAARLSRWYCFPLRQTSVVRQVRTSIEYSKIKKEKSVPRHHCQQPDQLQLHVSTDSSAHAYPGPVLGSPAQDLPLLTPFNVFPLNSIENFYNRARITHLTQ